MKPKKESTSGKESTDSPLRELAQAVRGSVYVQSPDCPGCGRRLVKAGRPVYLVNSEEQEDGKNHVHGVLVTVLCSRCSRRIKTGTAKQVEPIMNRLYEALVTATETGGQA